MDVIHQKWNVDRSGYEDRENSIVLFKNGTYTMQPVINSVGRRARKSEVMEFQKEGEFCFLVLPIWIACNSPRETTFRMVCNSENTRYRASTIIAACVILPNC